MGFSAQPEIRTFAALQHALATHGYLISQKARVLDVIEAVATNPAATLTAGPSLGELVVPADGSGGFRTPVPIESVHRFRGFRTPCREARVALP